MNITPVKACINTNINVKADKSYPSFRSVVCHSDLHQVFATPELAKQFATGLNKLQHIQLNLKEILHYDKCVGLYKMILEDFFNFIGKKEVEDYTAELKIERDTQGGYYKTVLYGASAVGKDDNTSSDKDNRFSHCSKLDDVGYDYTGDFYDTGIDLCSTIGLPNINELKWMLYCCLSRGIQDICAAIECNMYNIYDTSKLTIKEAIYRKIQKLSAQGDDMCSEIKSSEISDIRILKNAYRAYDATVYRVPAAEYMIKRLFKSIGIDCENTKCYSERVKGEDNIFSLTHKISKCMEVNELLQNAVRAGNYREVIGQIYDIYGTRIEVTSEAEISRFYNEFIKYVKAGYIVPVHVNNYHGNGIEPFFSKEQMNNMETVTKSLGLDTKCCDIPHENGFTCVNIRTNIIIAEDTLLPVEFQIRTRDVGNIINAFHYAYDVLNGKDILSQYDDEKQKILKPLINKLLVIKNNQNLKSIYNKYSTECYSVARNGGMNFPSATEYGLPEEISYSNLLKMQKLLNNG